ncbi:MAG: alpha/beta fold hydrolase [Thermoanaerobaculia bacterium]
MPFEHPADLPSFIESQLPFRRRRYRLETGGYREERMSFLEQPPDDGAAVLLLHGNPTWSFLWRKVMVRLPGFHCVAPDLIGFGLSDRLRRIEEHSLAGHADAVAELVARLDLRDVILVGQDWGGPIAAAVGSRLPDRVRGLLLANTSVLVPHRWRGTKFHRFARMPVVSDIAFRLLGFPQNRLDRVQGDPASIRGEVARAYRWPLSRWRDRAGPLALARMVPDSESHPSVAEIRRGEEWARGFGGPIALVWGERDPILGRMLRRHEEAFPSAHVVRTEAGHFLQEEVPDAIASAIVELDRAISPEIPPETSATKLPEAQV